MSIVPDSLALFRHGIDLLQSGERGIRPRLYRRHACPPCLVGKCCGTSRHAELDGRYGHSHSARKVTALVVDCVEHVSPLQLALAPSRPHSEPIWPLPGCSQHRCCRVWRWVAGTRNACLPPLTRRRSDPHAAQVVRIFGCPNRAGVINYTRDGVRSEEHTSELQSRRDLVCRLLLEKKKQKVAFTLEASFTSVSVLGVA